MSGVALKFTDTYSQYVEAPRSFLYASYMTALGSMLSDHLTLQSEIRPEPRFYTVLVGDSADDRKSTAGDLTLKFFRETFVDFESCGGIGSAEGLMKKLNQLSNSGTRTAKLLLFFDEFKQFVSKCKIDGSVLLPCVTTLFESNRYESHTKTSSIDIDSAYLSIIACTTRETFDSMWSGTFTDIGLNNRLFLVSGKGERRFAIPRTIPAAEKKKLQGWTADICTLAKDGLEMKIEDDAFDLYEQWYMGLERSVYSKRIDTYGLRFMPLLALNDGKTAIDFETVEKVITVMDWQLKVRRELTPIDADNEVARMEQKIRRQLENHGRSKRELQQNTNANRAGTWLFKTALDNLVSAQEIRYDKQAKVYLQNM